jgi:hypothetical protein
MPANILAIAGMARSYKGFCIARLADTTPGHPALQTENRLPAKSGYSRPILYSPSIC